MSILESQLEKLQTKYSGSQIKTRPLSSGTVLISIDQISLPDGWNQKSTSIRFLAPTGYPFAAPDCFWADEGLRLVNGEMPKASRHQPIPDTSEGGLWFSWHVQGWNPNHNDLLTFTKLIEQRLRSAE